MLKKTLKKARPARQMLFINRECAFRLSNLITIGGCNFLADSWFNIILPLTAPPRLLVPKEFLLKIYKPLMQDPIDIH